MQFQLSSNSLVVVVQSNAYERKSVIYNNFRTTKQIVTKLVEEVGISDTIDNYLHSVCEPEALIMCVHDTTIKVMKFYNSDYLDALTRVNVLFNFLRFSLELGAEDAKFLLEARVIGFKIKENYINFDTELTENEHEQLEQDGSISETAP